VASYTGEKQALRYNAISFYGNFTLKVIFAILTVIFAALSVYILSRALLIPISALYLPWLNLLPPVVPPSLTTGFVCLAVHFSKEEAKCRQAHLGIWDRQRADEIKEWVLQDLAKSQLATRSKTPYSTKLPLPATAKDYRTDDRVYRERDNGTEEDTARTRSENDREHASQRQFSEPEHKQIDDVRRTRVAGPIERLSQHHSVRIRRKAAGDGV
jgi:hypothetical protein